MRIYQNPFEAFKETERELFEMGISVHPETMQDKRIAGDPAYITKEIRGYSFKIVDWTWHIEHIKRALHHFFEEKTDNVLTYVLAEFRERVCGKASNPGTAYLHRKDLWEEFLHNDKFAYTYSERITPQLQIILEELRANPKSRQAIINIHSNICPLICGAMIKEEDDGHIEIRDDGHINLEDTNYVEKSIDLLNRGGGGRLPCSMYYQIMVREKKVDLIYTMRSCDFLVHFPVDISLALMLQDWFADSLSLATGTFTYFTGSLHAYQKDMVKRGIF